MNMHRNPLSVALMLSLSSCVAGACQLPIEWKLASEMKPPTVPYSPKLVFHAHETKPGEWSWRGSTVTYQGLLTELATLTELDPQPLFLFTFVEGHTCQELNGIRAGIAKATRCSADGVPCIEGTPAELP